MFEEERNGTKLYLEHIGNIPKSEWLKIIAPTPLHEKHFCDLTHLVLDHYPATFLSDTIEFLSVNIAK